MLLLQSVGASHERVVLPNEVCLRQELPACVRRWHARNCLSSNKNRPNSAPDRVIEVIYDFITLFKIHLVIPYYFTNWPASKAINKAVDKSVINQ